MSKFSKFIKDKTVVIVGPSPHLVGLKQGEYIDSFDVIIRMNVALPISKSRYEDVGTKCNLLSNCLNPGRDCGGPWNPQMWKGEGVKWLMSPYPNIKPFDRDINGFKNKFKKTINFHIPDKDAYEKLSIKLNCRPNTGIGTILEILKHQPKQLHITGFSFFSTGYDKEYRSISKERYDLINNNSGNHKQPPQRDYVFDLMESAPYIVTVDDFLKELYNEHRG